MKTAKEWTCELYNLGLSRIKTLDQVADLVDEIQADTILVTPRPNITFATKSNHDQIPELLTAIERHLSILSGCVAGTGFTHSPGSSLRVTSNTTY